MSNQPKKEHKSLTWDFKPEQYVSFATHKFSIIDSIEQASSAMDTDYVKEAEVIVTGRQGRVLFVTLPQMILRCREDGLLKEVDGLAFIGELGNRKILYDRSEKMNDKVIVSNPRETVTINLVDTRSTPPVAPAV